MFTAYIYSYGVQQNLIFYFMFFVIYYNFSKTSKMHVCCYSTILFFKNLIKLFLFFLLTLYIALNESLYILHISLYTCDHCIFTIFIC